MGSDKKNIKIKSLFLILFSILLLNIQTTLKAQTQKIYVVFRYDDYSSLSTTDLEVKIINEFQKNKISFTAGIIPFVVKGDYLDTSPQQIVPLNAAKISILKKAMAEGVIEPALHGYSHQRLKEPRAIPSEFSGLAYDLQLGKIQRGKEFLENKLGEKIEIFIPPWFTNDANTVRALAQLGFKCISSSSDSDSGKDSTLKFLPATTYLPGLRHAVNSARRSECSSPVIVAVFHPFEFVEVDKDQALFSYEQFCNLLSWVTSQPDLQIATVAEVIDTDSFDVARFKKNKAYYKVQRLIPPFLLKLLKLNIGAYLCSQFLSRNMPIIRTLWFFLTLLVIFSFSFISFKIGKFILTRYFKLKKLIVLLLAIIILIFSIIFVTKDHSISYRGFILILASLGNFMGISMALYFTKAKK